MGELSVTAGRRDPLRGMKFEVSFPKMGGLLRNFGFSKISGISQESEVIEYREGDEPIVQRKIPGLIKTGEVTLERGVANVDTVHIMNQWREQTSSANPSTADGWTDYRQPVKISVISREGAPEWVLQLNRAWPKMIEYGDLDANSSDIWITTLTLVYEQVIPFGSVPISILNLFPSPVIDLSFSMGG